MPQGPIPVVVAAPSFGATNVSAAAVIKATPGVIVSIICNTAGSITLNNCAVLSGAGGPTTANQVFSGSLTAGQILTFNFKCNIGITLSAVTSAVIAISYS